MKPLVSMRASAWLGILLLPLAVAWLDSHQSGGVSESVTARSPAVAHHLPISQPLGEAWDLVRAYSGHDIRDAVMLLESPGKSAEWYLVERTGRIVAFPQDDHDGELRVVVDLADRLRAPLDHEQGAVGLAFHPEAAETSSEHFGEFYVVYAGVDFDGCFWRLSRFREEHDPQKTLNGEVVLINQIDPHPWHNAGCLEFGPDGYLYVATGDGGGLNDQFENGQRIDGGLFSGILRIDVTRGEQRSSHPPPRQPHQAKTQHYTIPDDNPFVGVPDALEEFWSIGFRNPFRMAFDRQTGELWVGDTGALDAEEINIARRGSNHQWSYREGKLPFASSKWQGKAPVQPLGVATEPRYVYRRDATAYCTGQGFCVIGGFVYRGSLHSELEGQYLFIDYGSGRLFALPADVEPAPEPVEVLRFPASGEFRPTSLATDRRGEVYVVVGPTAGNAAAIFRLSAVDATTPVLPTRLSETGLFEDLVALQPAIGLVPYDIRSPLWSNGTSKRRWLSLPSEGTIEISDRGAWAFPQGTVLVKHFELPGEGGKPPQPLETRVLVRDDRGGIYGATYRWNEDGRDALLVPSAGADVDVMLPSRDGERRLGSYRLPSRGECQHCHNDHAGLILGVQSPQLNRPLHPGDRDTQLSNWSRGGFFQRPLTRAETTSRSTLVSIAERTSSLDSRVRSYLDTNCAHCHRPQANIRAWFDLRHETPLAKTGLLYGNVADTLQIPGGQLVVPGHPEKSLLYRRMSTNDLRHRMPPLAISLPDELAIQDVYDWIRQLPSETSVELSAD